MVGVIGIVGAALLFLPGYIEKRVVAEAKARGIDLTPREVLFGYCWVQLSGAVVWGLSFATLLTLVLTPVMLAAPKVYSRRFGWLWDHIPGRRRAASRRPPRPSFGNDDDVPRAAE